MKHIKCNVPGCPGNLRKSSHVLPKESIKASREWIRRTANKNFDENGDIAKYYNSFRICNRHFEADCFIPEIYHRSISKHKLKKRALPSLNLLPGVGSDLQPFLSAEEFYYFPNTFETNTFSNETVPAIVESPSRFVPEQSRVLLQMNDPVIMRKQNKEECEGNMVGLECLLNDTLNELKKTNTEVAMLRETLIRNEENWKKEKHEINNRLQALEEKIEQEVTGKRKSNAAHNVMNTENAFKMQKVTPAINKLVYVKDNTNILAKLASRNIEQDIMKNKPKSEDIFIEHDYPKKKKMFRKSSAKECST